ncbi:MAG TPA: substrate-binding domain-containing protein [Candidatus Acidoferrales bacterium]|nr:substrate-binding domain-containing protein [Candidatus Acidoferrales bacterium]
MTTRSIGRIAVAAIVLALGASFGVAQVRANTTHLPALPSRPATQTTQTYSHFNGPSFHRFANSTKRTTFVGGGATLPALGYLGSNASSANPSTPTTTSVWGYYAAHLTSPSVTVQYCQTGSGFGKKVYDGLSGGSAGVNGPCAPLGTKSGSTNGFGAPSALALTDPDLVAADAPLLESEYSTFVTNKAATRGEPTELPEIVGAISMFYNDPDTGTTQINLTDAQICGIVEGTITNWSQLGFKSRTLTFVYRSDGSGTTFSFSNHLVAVCGSTSGLNVSQVFFDPTGVSCPITGTPCVVKAAPPGAIGASGNPGVISTIVATTGSIGYAEAANSLASKNTAAGINFATVNSKDPIKNLPETAAKISAATGIAKDSIIETNGGAATVASLASVGLTPAHAGCVLLVKPASYANLSGGYPIVAVSYHLYAYSGNGTNDTNLRTLAQELTKSGINYNNNTSPNITTVDKSTTTVGTGTTGFSTLPSTFQSSILTASNSCINT